MSSSLLSSGQVPFCLSSGIRHRSPSAGDCMSRALPYCFDTLPRRMKNRTPTKAAGPEAQHYENSKSYASLISLHSSPHNVVVESCLPRVGRSPTLTLSALRVHSLFNDGQHDSPIRDPTFFSGVCVPL